MRPFILLATIYAATVGASSGTTNTGMLQMVQSSPWEVTTYVNVKVLD